MEIRKRLVGRKDRRLRWLNNLCEKVGNVEKLRAATGDRAGQRGFITVTVGS